MPARRNMFQNFCNALQLSPLTDCVNPGAMPPFRRYLTEANTWP